MIVLNRIVCHEKLMLQRFCTNPSNKNNTAHTRNYIIKWGELKCELKFIEVQVQRNDTIIKLNGQIELNEKTIDHQFSNYHAVKWDYVLITSIF